MELKTDHSFHIGEQHLKQGKPCQDYALSGMLHDNVAYAIVSDGCSSGGMTDIGSRLMALATLRSLEEGARFDMFYDIENGKSRDAYLESFRTSLKLETKDLLATSLWAVVNERGAGVGMVGDGVAALRYENACVVTSLEWQNNQPYYPAYRLGGLDQQFMDAHTAVLEPYTKTDETVHTGIVKTESQNSSFVVERGMLGTRLYGPLMHPDYGALQTVALFSDGVEQVDQFDRLTAVEKLLDFKSTKGQFVVRRMNRFIQEAKKSGRGPIDDIAQAVIHIHSE